MPFAILLVVGILALVLGYMEFKFHPMVGILTQVVAFLILLGVFIGAVGYGGGFLAFFTGSMILTYITVIALGLAIGNGIAEVV